MTRDEALKLVGSYISNKNLVKHMLAVEVCMRKLAKYFNEKEEIWGLSGLLHDLDYESTKDNFSLHGINTAKILEEKGVDKEIIDAIKSHPGHSERVTLMAKALYAVDPLTGLIVASALMHPQKSLKALSVQFILNRFKEKHFAKGANRDQIKSCSELGLTLEDFINICLSAMQEIDKELEL
jgi:putative nucleotidyltransferase with HDIG domain